MAQVEPMDIDAIESDFDNKENAFHCNNVLSRTSCTEKGYEELDVSELNMKLRYSITPASSPMSKSFTGPSLDNKNCYSEDHPCNTVGSDNGNLSRSLNSTLTKTEGLNKSKVLPLQTLSMEPFLDSNSNSSLHKLLDPIDNNVIISVNNANDIDENLSLPSTCSSEATTPTKEIPKSEGSPIMRGLKSVLSMFRPSQSPILPADNSTKQDILSPVESNKPHVETAQVSTPVGGNKTKDANTSKRTSPLKDSLVFNDDLERELLWKDETTIIFKDEKIPVHKLFFQNPITEFSSVPNALNTTVEHMEISCDESITVDKADMNINTCNQTFVTENLVTGESDNEFLDCETTFTKNESHESKNLIMDDVTSTDNAIDDLPSMSENAREINSEGKEITQNAICVTPDIVTTCTNQALGAVPNISLNMEGFNKNIIEATINFLSNEMDECSKSCVIPDVSLKNKPQVNKQLDNSKITLSVDNTKITHNKDVLNHIGSKDIGICKTENDYQTSMNLGCEEIKESEHLDNLSHLSVQTDIVDLNNKSEISHFTETTEQIGIIGDMPVTATDITIVSDNLASHSIAISNEPIPALESVANIDKFNIIDKLENSQCPVEKLKIDSITSNKDITIDKDSEKLVFKKNLIHAVENMPVTQTIKVGDDMSIRKNSVTFTDISNKLHCDSLNNIEGILDNNDKIIEDMSISHTIIDNTFRQTNNETPADNTCVRDLINPTNSPTVLCEVQEDLKLIDNIDVSNKYIDIKDIVKNIDKPISSQIKSEVLYSTNVNDNNMEILYNTNSKVDEMSNQCQDVSALIESETTVSTSPSEIPLPDEDDIEQNILELSGVYSKGCNKQVMNNFQVCDVDSEIDVKSELLVDSAKGIDSKLLNTMETASITNSVNEHVNEIIDEIVPIHKEKNNTLSCDTQGTSIPATEAKIFDSYNEIMKHDNVSLQTVENNILLEDDSTKNPCVPESIDKNVEENDPKILVNPNTVNEIKDDCGNISEKSSITNRIVLDIEKNCDLNSINKCEQVSIHIDNQISFSPEKIEATEEEIITSANNSPYVSVTDLDIITENISADTAEEINNPLNTSIKHVFSPSTSPKIVSKGYNFNFDDVDDPFATKTKIRMSPTPDTPNQSTALVNKEIKTLKEVPKKSNRRKSQPEKKNLIQKKIINSTFSDKLINNDSSAENCSNSFTIAPNVNVLDNVIISDMMDRTSESKLENCTNLPAPYDNDNKMGEDGSNISVTFSTDQQSSCVLQEKTNNDEDVKSIGQTLVMSSEKSTSSSEQYFSLGTSSGEGGSLMNRSKNVFNLPEIDDVNFNPFATKSKMRMSSPPVEKPPSPLAGIYVVSKSSFVTEQQFDDNSTSDKHSEHNIIKKNINDLSPNTSVITCSSKNTNDVDTTVREILTEDEDTIEGPFLEVNDLTDIQKTNNVDIEADMMNFEDISHEEREENLENGELFIDADAFEFLLNQNKSTTVLDSGKESLFLKFDPLFAKRVSSDGILAALSKVQKRQSTPKKVDKPTQKDAEKSSAGPSNNNNENYGNIEENYEDLSSTMTKPMMVVNPAVSSIITQKKSATPKLNRRSLTFTSPAMAVIDRLLSLSGNSSHLDHDASIPQIGREHSETDVAITQLRELLAEKEIHVHTLRSESKELKDRLATLEMQVRGLETESAGRLSKINELNERLLEKTKMNKSMAVVVEEYERTIASLIAETEHDKKRNAEERMRIIKERDEQTAHLTSMEVSFSDLHSKYEKSKQIILSCKENEDIYKKSIKEFQDNFAKMQNNYELLKQHATSKLNHANQELEKMNRAHEAEVLKLNAMIKRKELHITSLEETLIQKTKANEELTAICDELINKVG